MNDLEEKLNDIPEVGIVTWDVSTFESNKLILNGKYAGARLAHVAVANKTDEEMYHKLSFKGKTRLEARRFLAFVIGKFKGEGNEHYLGYAKHLKGSDGSQAEEIHLVRMDSITDYRALIEAMPVVVA